MAFDAVLAVRGLHVIAAALWVGSAVFMAFVLGPSLRAAGPAAGPFMMTVMRRGGLSKFFLSVGGVALVFGAWAYVGLGYAGSPFSSGSRAALNLGVLLAIAAFLDGMFVLYPNEKKMRALVASLPAQGPPPAGTLGELQKLAEKQGKGSVLSAALLLGALLLMSLRTLF